MPARVRATCQLCPPAGKKKKARPTHGLLSPPRHRYCMINSRILQRLVFFWVPGAIGRVRDYLASIQHGNDFKCPCTLSWSTYPGT